MFAVSITGCIFVSSAMRDQHYYDQFKWKCHEWKQPTHEDSRDRSREGGAQTCKPEDNWRRTGQVVINLDCEVWQRGASCLRMKPEQPARGEICGNPCGVQGGRGCAQEGGSESGGRSTEGGAEKLKWGELKAEMGLGDYRTKGEKLKY
jgi:hypothetical protein